MAAGRGAAGRPVIARARPTEARAAHEVAVRLGAAPLRAAVEALVRRGRLDVALPGRAGGRTSPPC